MTNLAQTPETNNRLSPYEIQANEFAEKHGIKLNVLGVEFKKYFPDDTKKRNVFTLELVNKAGDSYQFNFGASLNDSQKPVEISQWDKLKDTDKIEIYCGIHRNNYKISGSIKQQISKSDLETMNDKLISKLAESLKDEYNKSVKEYNKKATRYDKINEIVNSKAYDAIIKAFTSKVAELKKVKTEFAEIQKEPIKQPSLYDVLSCLQKYEVGTFEDFCNDYGYDTDSRKAYEIYLAVLSEYENLTRLFSPEILEEMQEIQ